MSSYKIITPGYTNPEVIELKLNNTRFKILCITLIFLLILPTGVSCRKKQQRPASPNTREEIPRELKSMHETAEDIYKEIEKLQEQKKKPDKPREGQEKKEEKEWM